MSYADRQSQLLSLLERDGLDAILLHSSRFDSRFIRWLTGISCRSAFHYLLMTREDRTFLEISYRVAELREKTKLPILPIAEENQADMALEGVTAAFEKVGLVGYAPFAHVAALTDKIRDLTSETESYLGLKSQAEQTEISTLASHLLSAMNRVGQSIVPGTREIEVEQNLAAELSRCSDRLACPLSVISGPRLADSTVGGPSERRLGNADALLIDAAIVKDGIYADLTRMYATGPCRTIDNYQRLLAAQKRIIGNLKLGISGSEFLELVQESLAAENLPRERLTVADVGHGLGFALHEAPFFFAPASESYRIPSGLVFTLEPEIFVDGAFVRVENMIAAVKNGFQLLA